MRIGLRLLLGFFLVLGLALFMVFRVFIEEVKPGTRLAMEDSLIDAANALALLAAPDLQAGRMADGPFAQAMNALPEVNPGATLWGFTKDRVHYRVTVTDARGTVVYDSLGQSLGQDHARWNDVLRTLRGEYGARSSAETAAGGDKSGSAERTAMHVAAPVRAGSTIIGVLTVSRPNHTLEPYIQRSRDRILQAAWVMLGVSLAIGLLLSWWIARSLSRLRGYALAVAEGERAELPRMGRLSGNTEFSDLAQAVERMRLKLEDKAYVETYVHTLTHELKSPLAAIRGAAELLQGPLPEAERQRFAAHIERQTERLHQLIEKLLGLADVERIRHLERQEPVDLVALTRERLLAAEPRWRRKGLQLHDRLGESAVLVSGDRFLIGQALQNLLENAIDFSPPDAQIALALQAANGRVTWSVQDQGPGIPDYAQAHIFERFYSLPRADTGEKSSGLGLCLVQEVSELHGGALRIESLGPPGGCRASWTLPLAR